ncbi:MAG: hypothetical protein GWO23_05020, partial [Gammaproteobacteria bacterium]|nr:hypothetical protein [Gammaproteobacteria bacterium]NIX58830.1 hypothetical protein [candidate division Zixibacteria bacterium]
MDKSIFKKLNLGTFIAIDTETTGLDGFQDDIIEFAGVKYVDGEPSETLELFIKP